MSGRSDGTGGWQLSHRGDENTGCYYKPTAILSLKIGALEHQRLLRRFRQTLERLGCENFEVYEQVGANWSSGDNSGRFVQIMRFRDRRQQQAVQAAERADPGAQAVIAEFCNLINFPYQQQQGLFAVGFYTSTLPVSMRRSLPPPVESIEENLSDEGEADETELDEILESVEGEDPAEQTEEEATDEANSSEADFEAQSVEEEDTGTVAIDEETPADELEGGTEDDLLAEEEPLAEDEELAEEELHAEEELPAGEDLQAEEELQAGEDLSAEDETSDEAVAAEQEPELQDDLAQPDAESGLVDEPVNEYAASAQRINTRPALPPGTEILQDDSVLLDLEEEGPDPFGGDLDLAELSAEEGVVEDDSASVSRVEPVPPVPGAVAETGTVNHSESELELEPSEESGLDALLSNEQFLAGLDTDNFPSPAVQNTSAKSEHEDSGLYGAPTSNRNGNSLSGKNGAAGHGEHAVGPRQGRFRS